jgi:hypothetical protein
MEQDEINQLVEQAGFHGMLSIGVVMDAKQLEAFAKLVAEKEREACVEIAESKRHAPHFVLTSMPSQNGTAVDIANLIRARGQ